MSDRHKNYSNRGSQITTLNLQVGASSDDAFENASGTVTINGTTMVFNNASFWIGYRFTGVTIPQGSTINSATLQYYVTSTARDDNEHNVYCQAADNAGTFTTGTNDISSRTLTSANTSVTANSVGVGFYSVSITAAVQEVVNRAGWTSGNALAAIMDALTGVNLAPDTYDNSPTNAAKLDIDYTASGGVHAHTKINQIALKSKLSGLVH